MTAVEVRRAADRAVTRTSWLDSRHSFSYGSHYDPANTHFGLLLACNEDRLAAGAGFGEHPHRDVEVVTWVLAGALAHADSAGHRGEATPGVVQRMSAGAGVRHAERAGPAGAHYVQMWLRPAAPGGEPAYDTVSVGTDPGLVEVVPLRQPAATLHAGRLPPGGSAILPPAEYLHVLVVVGAVELTGGPAGPPGAAGAAGTAELAGQSPGTVELAGQSLGTGDAARLTGAGPVELRTAAGAEVIAWGMRAGLSVG